MSKRQRSQRRPRDQAAAPPTTSAEPVTRQFVVRYGPLAAVLLIIFSVHVWIISAGHLWPTEWPVYGSYYGQLTDALLRGQLHLIEAPDPRLLALPDPYDPVANKPFRYHDAALYDGKYYLYWG